MAQVTVPPTGTLIVLFPNSSTLPELFGTPEPASTAFGLSGRVTFGTGGLPCRIVAIAGASGFRSFANCFCPRANCAEGVMIVLLPTTVIFLHLLAVQRAHELVRPGWCRPEMVSTSGPSQAQTAVVVRELPSGRCSAEFGQMSIRSARQPEAHSTPTGSHRPALRNRFRHRRVIAANPAEA